jgi:hypothetical protein
MWGCHARLVRDLASKSRAMNNDQKIAKNPPSCKLQSMGAKNGREESTEPKGKNGVSESAEHKKKNRARESAKTLRNPKTEAQPRNRQRLLQLDLSMR